MQIVNKIDNLITKLTELKPVLSHDTSTNEKKFNELLKSSITTNNTETNEAQENGIPSWVDLDYRYDPQNPRKPNMRELMEAISGKNIKDLYNGSDENWQRINRQASDLLHGVIGPNEDTRDWFSIMTANDIMKEAREQTGKMFEPEVDIQSNFDEHGVLNEQIAIIKDKKGNILRSLSNDITSTEETLLNFGATKESIPANLEARLDPEFFDDKLLTFLKNFDHKPTSIEKLVVQTASEVIVNKLSQEIPLDELAKL